MMIDRAPTPGSTPPSSRTAFRVLFRHKWKMAAFFFGTMSLVVAGLIVWPKTYTSDSLLFVRIGTESVALDPTATVHDTISLNESRENELNSELELLRSRLLLEGVVDRLGAHFVLHDGKTNAPRPAWLETLMQPVDFLSTALSGDISPAEHAVAKLRKQISVTLPRKSHVVQISCRAKNPQAAQQTLQAFVDEYLIQHGKANRTPGSYEFFATQAHLLNEELQESNVALRNAKNEFELVSLNGERDNIQAQANSIETALLQNNRARASSEARVAALSKLLDELPAQSQSGETTGLPNVAGDYMRQELYRVEILEKEASSRYTSEHPQVVALRRQVADLRAIFNEQEASRVQKTNSVNPVYQDVQRQLMLAQAEAAAQRAEAQLLAQQRDAVQAKIRTMNEREFRVTQLERQSQLLEASYRDYARNLEQARIDRELKDQKISNVNLVQPATLAARPSSPSPRLMLPLGFIFATAGAVLLAFAAEWFDRTLKTSEQVESELGIPVLFAVPRVTREDLARS